MSNRRKRYTMLCKILVFLFIFNTIMWIPLEVAAGTQKESVVSGLCNSSNSVLTFYIEVPAKTTANYSIKFTPNNKGKSLETITGSVKNTSSQQKKIKVSRKVGYYSSKYQYSVSANYNYRKTNYSDTDKVYSKIPSHTFTSSKFTWTEANIRKAKANKRVEIVLVFSGTVALDIFVTRGYCTKAAATAYSIAFFANDLLCAGASQDIRNSMIKDWGYRIKAISNSSRTKYTLYLLTYNSKGKLVDSKKCGTISMSPYCKSIK